MAAVRRVAAETQEAPTTFSTIANAVNRSGAAWGSRANGNFWQAFSIEP